MNIINDFKILNICESNLDAKKQQTDYKIRYVSEYIRLWAIISAERTDVEDINFIDCMCNAGVYAAGDCCTAIEVLSIFIEIAERHKYKNFNLYLNDYDKNKIDIVSKIVNYVYPRKVNNLRVYIENKDVNDYLDELVDNSDIFGRGKSTVLYIDPFDFGTWYYVKI